MITRKIIIIRENSEIETKVKLEKDALISATALETKAKLATSNKTDFQNFQPLGLEII